LAVETIRNTPAGGAVRTVFFTHFTRLHSNERVHTFVKVEYVITAFYWMLTPI